MVAYRSAVTKILYIEDFERPVEDYRYVCEVVLVLN